jgi:hypothetical protein
MADDSHNVAKVPRAPETGHPALVDAAPLVSHAFVQPVPTHASTAKG